MNRPHKHSSTLYLMCQEDNFRRWLAKQSGHQVHDPESADRTIKARLGITSKRELDTDPVAKRRFEDEILTPFRRWANEE